MGSDALAQGWMDTRKRMEKTMDADEKTDAAQQAVDGLEYHGVPVLRGVLSGWDGPEGRYWRAGVDAAMARGADRVFGKPPKRPPAYSPGVMMGVPPGSVLPVPPDRPSVRPLADALDQPTGEVPFPGFPEGGNGHG